MFRKIVSNLPFSPALVGQLGFYAKRLRKEEATRKAALIITALALVVQSLAVFNPPEAANASSNADFVPGGVSSVKDFLKYYDHNYRHIKSIFNSLGIKRSEIASAKKTVIGEASRYNWAMTSLYSYSQGQRAWDYGGGNVYYRPMRLTQEGGDRHTVFYAHSASMGWFAIKKDCGNLITSKVPHPPKPVAACNNLDVAAISGTNRYRFSAKATIKHGAKVKKYIYTVKKAGKEVKKISITSSKLKNTTTYKQTAPGTYHVYLDVVTSVGKKSSHDCSGSFTVSKKPAAACQAVRTDVMDRTLVSLTGSASTVAGAKVRKYTFVVTDTSGKVVKTLSVTSSKLSVSAPTFTLSKPGKYKVTLAVITSVGKKTDSVDCVKQFTIAKPQVCSVNPNLPPNSPDCQPCPGNPDIWIKDEDCSANIISTKTATNMTRGNINATTKHAQAGDKISYTLTLENQGIIPEQVTFKEDLHDVLEYATLSDSGGGTFNTDKGSLAWPAISLAAGQKESRTFVIQVKDKIPLTNTGTSNQSSYDCMMTNTFGNTVDVAVQCPVEKKVVEETVSQLPHTGPGENMIFAGVVLAVVVYFYARTRQLGKEVRLVRRNATTGAI